jgi:hypothetical protein
VLLAQQHMVWGNWWYPYLHVHGFY